MEKHFLGKEKSTSPILVSGSYGNKKETNYKASVFWMQKSELFHKKAQINGGQAWVEKILQVL